MAVGFVLEFPNTTQTDYDTVMQELGLDTPNAHWPSGIISHAAGPGENGAWIVVDEWESKEDFHRFYSDRLRQALQRAGMQEAQPRWFQLYNYYQTDTGRTYQRRAA